MNGTLTTDEENLIKDILIALGNNSELNARVRLAVMGADIARGKLKWNRVLDSIFKKLQNGRVTLDVS